MTDRLNRNVLPALRQALDHGSSIPWFMIVLCPASTFFETKTKNNFEYIFENRIFEIKVFEIRKQKIIPFEND